MSKCSKKSSAGHDDFPGTLFIYIYDIILEPLIYLINLSLSNGTFPEILKISKVVPLYKKGSRNDINNYRPIALQSIFSKLFEMVIYNRFINFININTLLNSAQHGFRKNKSTTTANFNFIKRIYDSLDSNLKTVAICYDFSKAFDCINHNLLLYKLNKMGINGIANNLIKSYLNNRQQFVSLKSTLDSKPDVRSPSQINDCGVPQGSILGPLLFLIFINDLPHNVSNSNITLYADDTSQLFKADHTGDISKSISIGVNEINEWCRQNGLVLNINKTVLLNFHTIQNLPDCSFYILLNGKSIKTVSNTKLLGLNISDTLSWDVHVNTLCSKLNSICYLLKKCRSIVNNNILINIYYAYFQSVCAYGIIFWGDSPSFQRAFIIQKRAIRIITKSTVSTSCRSLFKQLKILTVPSLFIYECIVFVAQHKELFIMSSDVHNCNTRSKTQLRLPPHRLSLYSKNMYCNCIRFYNKLPSNLKNENNISKLKKKLKSFFIENIFYNINEFMASNIK